MIEKITKLLKKLHRMRHKPDLHSFKAKIKNGVVYVEAEEDGVYIEAFTYDAEGKETRERCAVNIAEAAAKLESLDLDLLTVET